ncbi:MAG: hypothetical protein JRJ79_05635 [Deltaproteobacteria bacterium]|nr:hypothetical protein [Deltaproteobacteria bacterium]MBW1794694.1 hypothetical protein [Deltaproteobacteria bacterium]
MAKRFLIMTCLLLGMFVGGCVSIPREAVQVSAEIGTRVVESREAHVALVRQYMKEKRARINEFIAKEWIPEYAKQVFRKEAVVREWNRIVGTNDSAERLEFIIGLSERLQQRINAKRDELLAPVDELERLMVQRTNKHYDELIAASATLTTLLDSAAGVKERQQRVLAFMDADEKFSRYMTWADDLVGKIVSGKDAFEKNREKIEKIINRLQNE